MASRAGLSPGDNLIGSPGRSHIQNFRQPKSLLDGTVRDLIVRPARPRPATAGPRPSASVLGWQKMTVADIVNRVPVRERQTYMPERDRIKAEDNRVYSLGFQQPKLPERPATASHVEGQKERGRRLSTVAALADIQDPASLSSQKPSAKSPYVTVTTPVGNTSLSSTATPSGLSSPLKMLGRPPSLVDFHSSVGNDNLSSNRQTSDHPSLVNRTPKNYPQNSLNMTRNVISSWAPGNTWMHWHVDLSDQNMLECPLWVWQRMNLHILNLSSNRMFRLPDDIGKLAGLRELNLESNSLRVLPHTITELRMLQTLNVSSNELNELPSNMKELQQLRELKGKHNSLSSVFVDDDEHFTLPHLQVLEVDFNKIAALPDHLRNFPQLQVLHASYNRLTKVPVDIRHLHRLRSLDVSHNRLSELPVDSILLCLSERTGEEVLSNLACDDNPKLTFPPPEVANQGGEATALYVQAVLSQADKQFENKDLVLLVLGDGEAGKTSTINALLAESGKADKIDVEKRTVGINFKIFQPPGMDLSMTVLDLAGQAVYSMLHQFFFFRRAVYMFVWRARKIESSATFEAKKRDLESMVVHWTDAMQLLVPGASLILVVTHVDQVSKADVDRQSDFVRGIIENRVAHYRASNKSISISDVPILNVWNGGHSLRVNGPGGEGVQELKEALISFAKGSPWYKERIPGPYMKLRHKLTEISVQHGGEAPQHWLGWKEYEKVAEQCGIDPNQHLKIATHFLHDLGVLRYFGDVDKARVASEKDLVNNTMLDTVFISVTWIVDVIKGLIRHDRDALLEFFSKGKHKSKKMTYRATRLITHGVVHPSLTPFLWPQISEWPGVDSDMIHDYWVMCYEPGGKEAEVWNCRVAKDKQGLERALGLLEGLDIAILQTDDIVVEPAAVVAPHGRRMSISEPVDMGTMSRARQASGADSAALTMGTLGRARLSSGFTDMALKFTSVVVPALLSASRLFRVDARVFGDECLFRCVFVYSTIPSGFFERLIVRLRRHFSHMDFNASSAAFYKMGKKLQVFLNRSQESTVGEDDDEVNKDNMELLALFSSTTLWAIYKAALHDIEASFLGMQRVSFKFSQPEKTAARRGSENSRLLHGNLFSYERKKSDEQSLAKSKLIYDRLKQKGQEAHKTVVLKKGVGLLAGDKKAVARLSLGGHHDKINGGKPTLRQRFRRASSSGIAYVPPEQKVYEFEQLLGKLIDPIQVLVAHSPEAEQFADLVIECLKECDASLTIQKHIPGEAQESLVLLVCIDSHFERLPYLVEQFKRHAAKQRCVIPLIMQDYKIIDYAEWWPMSIPGLKQYSLFVDYRGDEWYKQDDKENKRLWYSTRPEIIENVRAMALKRDLWAEGEFAIASGSLAREEKNKRMQKTNVLFAEIRKGLEEWRGEGPLDPKINVSEGGAKPTPRKAEDLKTACLTCVEGGEEKPAVFQRNACMELQAKWRGEVLHARGKNEKEPVPPFITCDKGHRLSVEVILSSAIIYDSVPCPSCTDYGTSPPFCFNRQSVLSALDEENQGTGVVTCPKCLRKGLPAVRILDILSPEVFLSYQWGVKFPPIIGYEMYSTQLLVKRYKKLIETHADVLCWLDCEGGLSAGSDHVKQMTDGVNKAHVVVIFLSDAYCKSDNCRREYAQACKTSKYIIPVLIPPYDENRSWSGWNGSGPEKQDWWKHATVVSKEIATTSKVSVDWQNLSHFEPIDMRPGGGYDSVIKESAFDHVIVRRILGRFHRGVFILHTQEKKMWSKVRAITTVTRSLLFTKKGDNQTVLRRTSMAEKMKQPKGSVDDSYTPESIESFDSLESSATAADRNSVSPTNQRVSDSDLVDLNSDQSGSPTKSPLYASPLDATTEEARLHLDLKMMRRGSSQGNIRWTGRAQETKQMSLDVSEGDSSPGKSSALGERRDSRSTGKGSARRGSRGDVVIGSARNQLIDDGT